MKKILTFVACLAMCLSFASCGSKDDSSASSSKTESKVVTEASSEEESTAESTEDVESTADSAEAGESADDTDSNGATGASTSFENIDEYIEANKETFDTLKNSLKDSGMNLDIIARDNSLVYTYTFDKDLGDVATVKSSLDKGLESQKSTFENVCKSLKAAIPSVESVIVEYYDKNGDLITSGEYK